MTPRKKRDFKLETMRGSIKQYMKVRGLRSISVANYEKWKGTKSAENDWLHSLKLDLQDGYLYLYGYKKNKPTDCRSGSRIESATFDEYKYAFEKVKDILEDEHNIPSSIKRNILVKMSR